MNDLCILVVTHKEFHFKSTPGYFPISVGPKSHEIKNVFFLDDTKINISNKNDYYCELTALYWGWKNLDFKFFGLNHYRRFFKEKINGVSSILSASSVENILNDFQIIVPKPRFYLEGVKKHYINSLKSQKRENEIHIFLLKQVIGQIQPEYSSFFDSQMRNKHPHMFNMFIMSKTLSDKYCEWLFSILFPLEKSLKKNNVLTPRTIGALSEFMLDVWIKKNNIKYLEVPVLSTDSNLFKKTLFAIKRRFSR